MSLWVRIWSVTGLTDHFFGQFGQNSVLFCFIISLLLFNFDQILFYLDHILFYFDKILFYLDQILFYFDQILVYFDQILVYFDLFWSDFDFNMGTSVRLEKKILKSKCPRA